MMKRSSLDAWREAGTILKWWWFLLTRPRKSTNREGIPESLFLSCGMAPLIIPSEAVVVPGSRAISKGKGHPNAEAWGLSLYAPIIVKYRDEKTDLSTTLEDLLR